jgi:hypothetical protein
MQKQQKSGQVFPAFCELFGAIADIIVIFIAYSGLKKGVGLFFFPWYPLSSSFFSLLPPADFAEFNRAKGHRGGC